MLAGGPGAPVGQSVVPARCTNPPIQHVRPLPCANGVHWFGPACSPIFCLFSFFAGRASKTFLDLPDMSPKMISSDIELDIDRCFLFSLALAQLVLGLVALRQWAAGQGSIWMAGCFGVGFGPPLQDENVLFARAVLDALNVQMTQYRYHRLERAADRAIESEPGHCTGGRPCLWGRSEGRSDKACS